MLVDPRAGSGNFVAPLRRAGVPALAHTLEYADVAFVGFGPDGPTARIGIEIKSVTDAIDSFQSGRFASNQLPGLVNEYDYAWLAIHGRTRDDYLGYLEYMDDKGAWRAPMMPRPMTLAAFESWLLTIQNKAGIKVYRADDADALVRWLVTLWSWWGKPWDKHTSTRAMFQPHPKEGSLLTSVWSGRQDPKTLLRRLAAQLPGIGWERSAAIEKHFGGDVQAFLSALYDADHDDWTDIPGVGKGIASQICEATTQKGDTDD